MHKRYAPFQGQVFHLPDLVIYNGTPYLITWREKLSVIPHTVSATVIIEIATTETKYPSDCLPTAVSETCEPYRFPSICKIHNDPGFEFELIFFPLAALCCYTMLLFQETLWLLWVWFVLPVGTSQYRCRLRNYTPNGHNASGLSSHTWFNSSVKSQQQP
jgi:hypothetical protein